MPIVIMGVKGKQCSCQVTQLIVMQAFIKFYTKNGDKSSSIYPHLPHFIIPTLSTYTHKSKAQQRFRTPLRFTM